MPVVEVPGYEADDTIATLARQAVERGLRVVVVSADKDLLQLVDDDVVVLNPGREGSGSTRFDRKTVEEKWGVPPERIVDVLALVGDSVDNVPGVPGIGDKGARDLVREFGSVESVLEHADDVKRAAYREGLKSHRAEALLSKQLVTLRTDAPVTLDLEALRRQEPDRVAAHALFKELEFQVLAREYAPEVTAAAAEHRLLTRIEEIEAVAAEARKASHVGLGVVVTSASAMKAEVLGIALSWAPGPLRLRPPRATRRSTCPGPRPQGGPLGRSARSSRTRPSGRPRPTPSATASCSGASGCVWPGSPSTPSSRPTSSTPAGAPTRSRTSRWSTSASAARPARTVWPAPTRRRSRPARSRAPRPTSCCASTRR